MENERQQWRTDGSRERMVLGLIAVDRGKTEAIGRRSFLL
jgi:hypothetical protein